MEFWNLLLYPCMAIIGQLLLDFFQKTGEKWTFFGLSRTILFHGTLVSVI